MSTKMSLLAGSLLIVLALAGWKRGWRVTAEYYFVWQLRKPVAKLDRALANWERLTWGRWARTLEPWKSSSAHPVRPGRATGHSRSWSVSQLVEWKRERQRSSGESGTGSTDGFR